jgi:hypothetical protein
MDLTPIEQTDLMSRISRIMILMTGDPEVPEAYRRELVEIIGGLLWLNRSTSLTDSSSARGQPTGESGSSPSWGSGPPSP